MRSPLPYLYHELFLLTSMQGTTAQMGPNIDISYAITANAAQMKNYSFLT